MMVAAVLVPLTMVAAAAGWGVRRMTAEAEVAIPWWVWLAAPVLVLVPLLVPLVYVVAIAWALDRLGVVAPGGLADRVLDVVLGLYESVLDGLASAVPAMGALG